MQDPSSMIIFHRPHATSLSYHVPRVCGDPILSARGPTGVGITLIRRRTIRLDPSQQTFVCSSVGLFCI